MKTWIKVMLWFCGAILLIILLHTPIYETDPAWKTSALSLSGQTIVIDPGHGGVDGGAVGKDKTQEKIIALKVAKMTRAFLEEAGAIVYMTREGDYDLAGEGVSGFSRRKSIDIRNRLDFIHKKEADLFITIHLNSLPSSRWHGAQTFYYDSFAENKQLATFIQDEIIRNLQNTTRVPLEINTIYLLKHAEVPGALVEIGFLSNEAELAKLKDENYQRQMAASIYQGIIRYLTEEDAGTISEGLEIY